MMTIENKNFAEFLQSKEQKQYFEKIKDYNYYFFKIPYDEDCDFIYLIRVYISQYNKNGKPGLTDGSTLGGLYVYSLDLLFNVGYDLCENFGIARDKNPEMRDAKDYYNQLCKEIGDEVKRRVYAGQFDRNEAEILAKESKWDMKDIEYYKEYRELSFAESDFLDGKQLSRPEIHITYDTRCEYDIASVLEYLRTPTDIINARATAFIDAEKARIYKQLIRAEIHFKSLKEIEADTSNPLHYRREIRGVIKAADVKTVNATLERNGHGITVKMEADRLGINNSLSDWDIIAADRYRYKQMFGYNHGGDAHMDEIQCITHGKKELYNKAAFEKTLLHTTEEN